MLSRINVNTYLHEITWQEELTQAVTTLTELCRLLELDPNKLGYSSEAALQFPMRVPRSFVARMQKGNANDPLLQQVLPTHAENVANLGFGSDPLEETKFNPVPGILHKYNGRVLWLVSQTCAVHCRYCFRRHFPYDDQKLSRKDWQIPLNYIAQNKNIFEVILSGGDPLTAKDSYLQELIHALADIPHLKIVRLHTRLPIVLPARVTNELVQVMQRTRLQANIVLHSNHPQEIDAIVGQKIKYLQQNNITVLNQTVLLKGINDDANVLSELSKALFQYGALPYYLHTLDKVQGAAHYDIPLARARKIHRQMQEILPGYLVPRLVCEQAGAKMKVMLS